MPIVLSSSFHISSPMRELSGVQPGGFVVQASPWAPIVIKELL
jgi:hypothetical protein